MLERKSCVVLIHTSGLWSHKEKKEKREKREERENGKTCVCDQTKILGPGLHKCFSMLDALL
jgi:hypothetical protein